MERYYDTAINVGGPIKKDKIWWFGTYRKQFNAVSAAELHVRQDVRHAAVEPVGKGTYQMNQKNKLIGYYQWGQKLQPNRLPFGDLHLRPTRARPTKQNSAAGSTRVNGTARVSDKLYVEARYGDFGYYFPLRRQQRRELLLARHRARCVIDGAHQK